MSLPKARHQSSVVQTELPLAVRGEALRDPRSGEAERSGTSASLMEAV